MNDNQESDGADALGQHEDLPQVLAMVRALIRELARRKLSPLLAAREDASDLAQSVVLELMQHGMTLDFRGPAATRALARTVLERLLSDKMRALKTKKRDHGRELRLPDENDSQPARPMPEGRANPDPAILAEAREMLELGERKMARLGAREREVVRRRVGGEAHREIAAALGISEALSQRLLSDARRKLCGG